jgi:hypothetical protein
MERGAITFETFELAADAWDWLDTNGFLQSEANKALGQLNFEHADGRRAIMYLPQDETGDQETELKIFG